MHDALKAAEAAKTKPGRPSKLGLEDQLLMTLLYWRAGRIPIFPVMSDGPVT
jgi:hypothetical protein